MIRNLANRLIRSVYPRWVTTGEKLRLLNKYYTSVDISNYAPVPAGVCCIICNAGDTPADVHIAKSRKEAIDRAYEELHKLIFFTQLHVS